MHDKDFAKFRERINPAFYEELGEKISNSFSSSDFPITEENAGNFISKFIGLSMHASLSMLEGYHNWLKSNDD